MKYFEHVQNHSKSFYSIEQVQNHSKTFYSIMFCCSATVDVRVAAHGGL
jgi:hypothetical protein